MRKYTLSENYFDLIDSNEKAYWLGLLITDGYLTKEGNGIGLTLKESDSYLLERLRIALNSNAPLRQIVKTVNYKSFNAVEFFVSSKKLYDRLMNIGITPQKSFTMKYPSSIPRSLNNSFIRGIIDGNGCVHINKAGSVTLEIVGASEEFLRAVQENIRNELGIDRSIKARDRQGRNTIYRLRYGSQRHIQQLTDWLYDGAVVCMERKRSLLTTA